MTDILAAIDGALDAHATTAAEVTGNPWPGRVPDLDEVLEVLFGPEDGAPLPVYVMGRTTLAPPVSGWTDEPIQGVSPVQHFIDHWVTAAPAQPAAGRSADFVVLDEAFEFAEPLGSGDTLNITWSSGGVFTWAAMLPPPDPTAFRVINGGA